MAAPFNFSNPGAVELSAADKELFVIEAKTRFIERFMAVTQMRELHEVVSISGAKGQRYPINGPAVPEYFPKGARDDGQVIISNEKLIDLDDFTNASTFVFDWDHIVNHWDESVRYAGELGYAIGYAFETNCFIEHIKAARSAALITGYYGGSTIKSDAIVSGDFAIRNAALSDALRKAASILDNKNIPREGRYVILHPDDYNSLIDFQNASILWRSTGNIATLKMPEFMGFELRTSTLLPTKNILQGANPGRTIMPITNVRNYWHFVDASKTRAICGRRDVLMSLEARAPSLTLDRPLAYKSLHMVTDAVYGHGFMHPECAVEIATDTIANP